MDRKRILAKFLGVKESEIKEGFRSELFEYDNAEYLVLKDEEADKEAEEILYNYIDEVIYPQIPENLRYYFDEEKFIEDVIMTDGRGHVIASYDGVENEIQDDEGNWWYIYRIN